MDIVLCTKEYADEHTLQHYRVGGERKGVRRWQDKEGNLTEAGRQHYADMYGWGKFRADRADRKAEKYSNKADKAEANVHKAQVKVDKAQVKVDRKQDTKSSLEYQKALNQLHENQLTLDLMRNKAEEQQAKSDRIHDKWDEKTRKIERKAANARKSEAEMRYWKEQTEAEGKGSGEAHSKYSDLEKKFASKVEQYERELQKRGIVTSDKPGSEKREPEQDANAKTSQANDGDPHHKDAKEWTKEDRFKAWSDQAEKDSFVKSAKEKLASGNEKDRAKVLTKLFGIYHEGQKNIDDPDYQEDWLYGSGDFKEDIGHRNDRIRSLLWEEIDRVSGNENTGEYKSGSNGQKAHDALMESYEKSWDRRDQVARENGINPSRLNSGRDKTRAKEYDKLKKALSSDKVYQALAENNKKSEDALLSAILKDLGVLDSPENRSLIFPIVFRD